MALAAVPSLLEVVQRPELLDDLPAPVAAVLILECEAIIRRAVVRIALQPATASAPEPAVDDVLTLDEAASFLRLAPETVARMARTDLALRRCRLSGRRIRFRGPDLRRYARRGA